MKKPKWYARALYLAFALALVVGLTAPAAVAADATASVTVTAPVSYTKVGENVTFTATFSPAGPDSRAWSAPGGTPSSAASGDTFTCYFSAEGPATVTCSALWGTVAASGGASVLVGVGLIPQVEYNVAGSSATFRVPDAYVGNVSCWSFSDTFWPSGTSSIISGGTPLCPDAGTSGTSDVTLRATGQGETWITAQTAINLTDPAGNDDLMAVKKWGKIYATTLSPETSDVQIIWNENCKAWEGNVTITETVTGMFKTDGGTNYTHAANGSEVHWFIMDATAPVHDLPSGLPKTELIPLVEAMQTANPSRLTGFGDCTTKTTMTVSGDTGVDGTTQVTVVACGEEAVKIVVVATYPEPYHKDQWPVFPEIASVNIWTQQLEKVPQVRWAGEKIVLEKEFGTNYIGMDVSFKLENQSPGCLEGLYTGDTTNLCQTVWTTVQSDGVARCMFVCEDQGEVDIDACLLDEGGNVTNQHGFVLFYLKFEGITLGNVVGARAGHDTGLWTPANPWNATADVVLETLNVSEDTLLRARVKGWFEGDNMSWRPSVVVDLDGDGFSESRLPEGRWVLPDDWPILAGPDWAELRPRWDIMDNPYDDVVAPTELGAYAGAMGTVANAPVIGPYSSLDTYLAAVHTPLLDRKTIVRNGKLEWWDTPMPPAKIVFKITDEGGTDDIMGFFKDADKGVIYYLAADYTNPFYEIMIPASPFIPPFVNNGGYDWNSWDAMWGSYELWEIFNQLDGATPDDPQHPTKVEVYSDNHGEAMVFLNGDWNLDWSGTLATNWVDYGAYDIPTGTVVGDTTLKAMADYPYFRKHIPAATSDTAVTKNWTWGKDIQGADPETYKNGYTETGTRMVYDVVGMNNTKVAFIWATDRDGMAAPGERVDWLLQTGGCDASIATTISGSVTLEGGLTVDITNGFLASTSGALTGSMDGTRGTSLTKTPGAKEIALWTDTYGGSPHHGVAAVVISSSIPCLVDLQISVDEGEQIGTIIRHTNMDLGASETLVLGDANQDGDVNMGDVTKTERIILDLDAATAGADANQDGAINMGDVTKTERIILGA